MQLPTLRFCKPAPDEDVLEERERASGGQGVLGTAAGGSACCVGAEMPHASKHAACSHAAPGLHTPCLGLSLLFHPMPKDCLRFPVPRDGLCKEPASPT